MARGLVSIGSIESVQPARREVRLTPPPRLRDAIDAAGWLTVTAAGGVSEQRFKPVRCKISGVRWHGDAALIALATGVPRDTVAGMRGLNAAIEAADAPRREDDAIDAAELMDMLIVDETGREIGRIVGVIDTPAHGVLEIEGAGGDVAMIPAIPETIVRV
ncbi:MAG: hypothetical protein WD873_04860, partial [Candidatus Hydrogenedentales bacterium]